MTCNNKCTNGSAEASASPDGGPLGIRVASGARGNGAGQDETGAGRVASPRIRFAASSAATTMF